jgi:hypothetical protein
MEKLKHTTEYNFYGDASVEANTPAGITKLLPCPSQNLVDIQVHRDGLSAQLHLTYVWKPVGDKSPILHGDIFTWEGELVESYCCRMEGIPWYITSNMRYWSSNKKAIYELMEDRYENAKQYQGEKTFCNSSIT